MRGKTVAVAMSGGVDSSVAAALLKEQGYNVFGMMLRLWSEPGKEIANRCCTPAAMGLARKVAAQLDIPFYVIDAKDTFHDTVVQYFIDGYSQGGTPNPCLICNRHIRWEFLLNHALSLGADYMATGHYARAQHSHGNPVRLFKGKDENKDQSYVLHVLSQEQLQHALFPVGEYTKAEVRSLAEKFGLPVAQVKDSQDLCFLGGSDFSTFLMQYAPEVNLPGDIFTRDGEILGSHQGLAFYTIGQRKGLGIAFPEPLYVIEKDIPNNKLIVGTADQLGERNLFANQVTWVSGTAPDNPFQCKVKIRYTAKWQPGIATPLDDDRLQITLDHPARDITPGQAAVIYNEDEVIGGGIIEGEHTNMPQLNSIKLIHISA